MPGRGERYVPLRPIHGARDQGRARIHGRVLRRDPGIHDQDPACPATLRRSARALEDRGEGDRPGLEDRAVVLGAGPIGILGTILLRLRGLDVHVYAKSSSDTLQGHILTSLGASYETVADHPVTGIKEELGQIDFILEGTGNSEVAFAAMAQLGINGVLCLTGVSAGNRQIEIPSDVINLQMVLGNRLAFGSVNANRRYFEMGVQHFQQAERQWPGIFERLITRRVPLDDFTAALDRRPEDIKTLLTIAPA
ncbi:MAG: hypothetical protein E6I10_00910 [Chloroflexi bacterium]|nr:MAG: hypothetical protein E6I10_00910 [Chloroflexota bacterium]